MPAEQQIELSQLVDQTPIKIVDHTIMIDIEMNVPFEHLVVIKVISGIPRDQRMRFVDPGLL